MAKPGPKKGTMPKGKAADQMFKPGQSGNPKGRSSAVQKLQVNLEQVMADFLLEEEMVEVETTDKNGRIRKQKKKMTRLKRMITRLYKEATEGESVVKAQSEILDRAFGKAQQKIEHSGIQSVMIVDDVPSSDIPK